MSALKSSHVQRRVVGHDLLNEETYVNYHYIAVLIISAYHCHLHSLQAANCCRNSRLVVNKDDLNCVTLVKIYCYYQNSSMKIVVLKPIGVGNYICFEGCKMML